MADWSWEGLKGKVGGLLNDPAQMTALMESPMFQAGMGLLSENSKPFGGNAAQGVLGGLASANETKQQREDRERMEKLRAEIAEWLRQQQMAGMGGQQTPSGGWQSPVPPTQAPPTSIMDLMKPR